MVRTVSTNVIAIIMGHVSQKMENVFVNQAGRGDVVTNVRILGFSKLMVS